MLQHWAAWGAKTGQKMADYAIEGGRFAKTCLALHSEGVFLPWIDRHPVHLPLSTAPGESSLPQTYQTAKLEVL